MTRNETTPKDNAVADAIHALAQEMRILTFGGASLSKGSHGAIEGMTMTVGDTGKEIASSIGDVAAALSEVAEAINKLADSVADLKGK